MDEKLLLPREEIVYRQRRELVDKLVVEWVAEVNFLLVLIC